MQDRHAQTNHHELSNDTSLVRGSLASRRLAILTLAAIVGALAIARWSAPALAAPPACPNRTLAGFSPTLPDCRAYELVSNPIDETYIPDDGESTGGEIGGTGEFIGSDGGFLAALNGEAIAYVGGESNSGEGGNGSTSDGVGNQYMAQHSPQGWEASDVSPPINALFGYSSFGAFSPDLSVQAMQIRAPASEPVAAEPAASAECVSGGQETAYSRTASGYHALITSNVPGSEKCNATPAGISANDSHYLLEAQGAFTQGAMEGAGEEEHNLYDSVAGSLYQVNILPDGEPEPHPFAAFGVRYDRGANGGNRDGAFSANGSRIFWTALQGKTYEPKPKALYVRLNDDGPQSPVAGGRCTVPGDACTVQVDAVQGGSGVSGNGYFWGASEDGSKVFFTDCNSLTADSTAHSENACSLTREGNNPVIFTGSDLYEYDLEKPEGERLTDLTVDHNPADPLGADVQGVIGVSDDGSSVYFVADGELTGANHEGKTPVSGQPNLYVIRGGATSFVATLAARIRKEGGDISGDDEILPTSSREGGDWLIMPGERTAEVTASGSAIAFESRLELTGYNNDGVVKGGGHEHIPELFVYKADSGRLVCASCDPSGAPPSPWLTIEATQGLMVGTLVSSSMSAVFMPHWVVEREGLQVYFMTSQPLVSTDHNELQDVYEWRSEGSGGCQEASGCLSLISTAEPQSNAYFIDASVNGSDVFFTTRTQLTADGIGETLKLYDARVDGGRSEPAQACTGTGCQGVPPAPPVFATPSSVTFSGTGNYGPPPPPAAKKSKTKPKSAKCKPPKHGRNAKHNRCAKKKQPRRARRSAASSHGSQK